MFCIAISGTTTPLCYSVYATSSFAATYASASADTGYVVAVVVASVVAGAIALMGLGFGIRHLRKYITGKKF
jgi:hypothetical protein